MRRLQTVPFAVARELRAAPLLIVVALFACAIDDSRAERCGPGAVCPQGFECYRSFCVPLDQVGTLPVGDDAGAVEDADGFAGELGQPHMGNPDSAVEGLHDASGASAPVVEPSRSDGPEPDAALDSKGASEPDASLPSKLPPLTPDAATMPPPDPPPVLDAAIPEPDGSVAPDGGVAPTDAGADAGPIDAGGDPPRPAGAVGDRCDEAKDCAGGVCLVPERGGYCSATCRDEGSTAQCPSGSVCKRSKGRRSCLRICILGASCPAESSCRGVSGSLFSACEPRG